jgi:hypothetical protein
LTAEDIAEGKSRPSAAEMLEHYEKIAERIREAHGKPPYDDWAKSYKNWTTYDMSHHLPIWMELEIDYSDDDLRRFL